MNLLLSLVLFSAASFYLVSRTHERALYVLYVVAFLQNLIVPFLYTSGVVGTSTSLALIILKELLLLALFLYSLRVLKESDFPWPKALRVLLWFTIYCSARGLIAFLGGDRDGESLRILRQVCYPMQIFTVGFAIAASRPEFTRRFIRRMMIFLVSLALVGILMFASIGTDFWVNYVNVAAYNIDVKGEDPALQDMENGVSATGQGRNEFGFLSEFRAMGTFGDPIAMGFAISLPILLFLLYYPLDRFGVVSVGILLLALFLTFTRSAWIYATVSGSLVLFFRRQYKVLLAAVAAVCVFALIFSPLASFISSTLAGAGDSDYQHTQGVTGFYTKAFSDPGNLFGKGLPPDVQKIPESGYAYLLEHFGLAALILFVWFHVCLYQHLARARAENKAMAQIGQVQCVASLVTLHFSQYPLGFIPYLFIWFYLGASMLSVSPEVSQAPSTNPKNLPGIGQRMLPNISSRPTLGLDE